MVLPYAEISRQCAGIGFGVVLPYVWDWLWRMINSSKIVPGTGGEDFKLVLSEILRSPGGSASASSTQQLTQHYQVWIDMQKALLLQRYNVHTREMSINLETHRR